MHHGLRGLWSPLFTRVQDCFGLSQSVSTLCSLCYLLVCETFTDFSHNVSRQHSLHLNQVQHYLPFYWYSKTSLYRTSRDRCQRLNIPEVRNKPYTFICIDYSCLIKPEVRNTEVPYTEVLLYLPSLQSASVGRQVFILFGYRPCSGAQVQRNSEGLLGFWGVSVTVFCIV